jgi:hypothetical protein
LTRAFTSASTADSRLLSTIAPGWTSLDLVEHPRRQRSAGNGFLYELLSADDIRHLHATHWRPVLILTCAVAAIGAIWWDGGFHSAHGAEIYVMLPPTVVLAPPVVVAQPPVYDNEWQRHRNEHHES